MTVAGMALVWLTVSIPCGMLFGRMIHISDQADR